VEKSTNYILNQSCESIFFFLVFCGMIPLKLHLPFFSAEEVTRDSNLARELSETMKIHSVCHFFLDFRGPIH